MNRKLGIVLSLFTLLGGSALAYADPGAQAADPGCADKRAARHEKKLERFDTNHDGKIDDSERAAMKASFAEKKEEVVAKYDTNHDGTLDATERAAMKKDFVAKMFSRLDTNGDGVISLSEAQCTRLAKRFAQIDTDGSGTLTQAEVVAAAPMGGHHQHAMRGTRTPSNG
jgi:Ca2+-binding EF-hand superfamily protein